MKHKGAEGWVHSPLATSLPPNICKPSVWNLLHVIFLAPRVLRRFVAFGRYVRSSVKLNFNQAEIFCYVFRYFCVIMGRAGLIIETRIYLHFNSPCLEAER